MDLRTIAGIASCLLVTGCGNSASGSGAKTIITEAQFAEVKANCHLDGATLRPTNTTTRSTDANGTTSTVTTTYEGAPAGGKSIQMPDSMSQDDIASAIPCLKGEFERLGVVEAPVSLPAKLGF